MEKLFYEHMVEPQVIYMFELITLIILLQVIRKVSEKRIKAAEWLVPVTCVVITLFCMPGWGKSYNSFPIMFNYKSLHQ